MAKKEIVKEVEAVKETVKLPDNVALVKQKILDHLHGKKSVDLQELYNLL